MSINILALRAFYNPSDDQTKYQVQDWLSFHRCSLGLSPEGTVLDAKALSLFREQLVRHSLIEMLLQRFDEQLWQSGLVPKSGQIIDASLVNVLKSRNTRDENWQIKEGKMPEGWRERPNMKRQKDEDARWTKKQGKSDCGYIDHIDIDRKHRLVRRCATNDASARDNQAFDDLLDAENSDRNSDSRRHVHLLCRSPIKLTRRFAQAG